MIIMETVKDFLKRNKELTNTDKSILLTMFNHVEIDEDEYKLVDIFDKLIEKTIKSGKND